jgi:hypothetical protein
MSFMDCKDPIIRTMTKKEEEDFYKLPIEEREYQKYLIRIRIFPPYDQLTLTRDEFYKKYKEETNQSARFLSTIKSE